MSGVAHEIDDAGTRWLYENGSLWMRLRLWYWLRLRPPEFRPGDVVANCYSGGRAGLSDYIGPYVGYTENGRPVIEELWRTGRGDTVAVGYHWLPVFGPQ